MKSGEIYTIILNGYGDKYLVTAVGFNGTAELRRVQLPKTKIDALRRPINILISFYGDAVPKKQVIKKSKKKK